MSYEIIKSISVIKNPNDSSEYVIKYCSASNNVHPRYYSEDIYGAGKGFTKEQLEKLILLDYFKGNFQKGSNKYNQTVQGIGMWYSDFSDKNHPLHAYYRYSKLEDKVTKRYWKLRNKWYEKNGNRYPKEGEYPRVDELSKLISKLNKLADSSVENALYNALYNKEARPVIKPFVLKLANRNTTVYVSKLNKRSYYTTFNIAEAQVFKTPQQLKRIEGLTNYFEIVTL